MKIFARALTATALLAIALIGPILPAPVLAAQSYDNCTGYIDTLPATISTQGTWCLRHDLATAITSGDAITVATNNVTIDCNDFKMGGLAAGVGTGVTGISATNKSNVTVRRCNLRGFFAGAYFYGGSGHLVEDNRVDGATTVGLWIDGDNSIIRGNRITDTGGNPVGGNVNGITTQGDNTVIADNVVTGVTGTADASGEAVGIFFNGEADLVRGNYVSTILAGAGTVNGISSNIGYMSVLEQNVVINPATTTGGGIYVPSGATGGACINNRVRHFTSPYGSCVNWGGNFSN